jgi:hypothetical protein
MPIKTLTQPIRLEHGPPTIAKTFVYCAKGKDPASPQAQRAARIKADPTWRYFELDTGHNLHYSAPRETVEILLQLAAELPAHG